MVCNDAPGLFFNALLFFERQFIILLPPLIFPLASFFFFFFGFCAFSNNPQELSRITTFFPFSLLLLFFSIKLSEENTHNYCNSASIFVLGFFVHPPAFLISVSNVCCFAVIHFLNLPLREYPVKMYFGFVETQVEQFTFSLIY